MGQHGRQHGVVRVWCPIQPLQAWPLAMPLQRCTDRTLERRVTAFTAVPEKISAVLPAAAAVHAEWQPMYQPSKEQAAADRAAAYAAGVPHGERNTNIPSGNSTTMLTRCHAIGLTSPLRLVVVHNKYLQGSIGPRWRSLHTLSAAGGPCGAYPVNTGEMLCINKLSVPHHTVHKCHVCVDAAAGYVAPGDKFKDQPTIELQVVSELVSLLC